MHQTSCRGVKYRENPPTIAEEHHETARTLTQGKQSHVSGHAGAEQGTLSVRPTRTPDGLRARGITPQNSVHSCLRSKTRPKSQPEAQTASPPEDRAQAVLFPPGHAREP